MRKTRQEVIERLRRRFDSRNTFIKRIQKEMYMFIFLNEAERKRALEYFNREVKEELKR